MSTNRLAGLPPEVILFEGRKLVVQAQNEAKKVVKGEEMETILEKVWVVVLANGHVLFWAFVGQGKTLLLTTVALTIQGIFKKMQLKSDIQPSEISGYEISNPITGQQEIKHGFLTIEPRPNIVLLDEFNRAAPKGQGPFLEAMEERHVTVAGQTFLLPEDLFCVFANRNPTEHDGVFPLNQANLDRFMMQIRTDDPSLKTIVDIVSDPDYHRISRRRFERIEAVMTTEELAILREAIFSQVYVSERATDYIARLRKATWTFRLEPEKEEVVQRSHWSWPWSRKPTSVAPVAEGPNIVAQGASPRGAIELKKAATIAAFLAGRDYVTPDDVRRHAIDILAHRIFIDPKYDNPKYDISGADIVREVLQEVIPDGGSYERPK